LIKKLHRVLIAISILIACSGKADAQYFTSVGARVNNLPGISFKQFSHRYRGSALEVILASYQLLDVHNFGYQLSMYYEMQKRLPYFKALGFPFDYFYGVGLQAGYYNDNILYGSYDNGVGTKSFSIGPSAIIGLERRLKIVPLTIGIDFRAYYEIAAKKMIVEQGAITIRYVFE
jgi:hypothetical protein